MEPSCEWAQLLKETLDNSIDDLHIIVSQQGTKPHLYFLRALSSLRLRRDGQVSKRDAEHVRDGPAVWRNGMAVRYGSSACVS